VSRAVFAVHPTVADDVDLGDASAVAGIGGAGGGAMKPRTPIYGLMAEFDTPEAVLHAARRARPEGYTHMAAFTPYPVEGVAEELGLPRTRVPFVVLMAGLVGMTAGFFMQYQAMVHDYPYNSGGRPYNSWPAFIPITFEMMVLVAA